MIFHFPKMIGTIPLTLGDIPDTAVMFRDFSEHPSELLHLILHSDARSKCRYAFKCVTLWVRIYVDMSGTLSATMINIDILICLLIPTYNTKIFIVWTTYCFRYLSYCLSIYYIARDETSLLISLPGMYSFTRITNVLFDRHFDHLSGQTMMNIIIPEWAQKVSLHRQE